MKRSLNEFLEIYKDTHSGSNKNEICFLPLISYTVTGIRSLLSLVQNCNNNHAAHGLWIEVNKVYKIELNLKYWPVLRWLKYMP